MTPEEKLTALWAEAAPPAHDAAFTLAVMERVERRRMWAELVDLAPWVIVLGVLAWALSPAVEDLFVGVDDMARLATTGTLVAICLLLGIWLVLSGSRSNPALS